MTTAVRLIPEKAAREILGCGKTHLYALARKGELRPVKLTEKASRWVEHEVRAIAVRLIARRDDDAGNARSISA